MTIELRVHLPGKTNPVDLDEFANIIVAIVGYGTYEQRQSAPAYLRYENPKTGMKCSVGDPVMTRSN